MLIGERMNNKRTIYKRLEYKKIVDKIEELHKKKCLSSEMYEEFYDMMNNFDYSSRLFHGKTELILDVKKILLLLKLSEKIQKTKKSLKH